MIVLGIDTSTRQVGAALGTPDGVVGAVALGGPASVGPPRHTEQLAPAIEYLLRATGVQLRDVDAIGVGIGPGMFTGLRVGVVTATVLAQALGIPVVPVPSLELLAHPLRTASNTSIVPIVDARRAEVYYAIYQATDGALRRMTDYAIARPEAVAADIATRGVPVVLCGDGMLRFREVFATRALAALVEFAGSSHVSPSLAALIELTCAGVVRGEGRDPGEVTPLYLRQSDAEINARRCSSPS